MQKTITVTATNIIIYIDGPCPTCQRFSTFLMKRISEKIISITPLQGETANQRLPSHLRDQRDSVVVEKDGHFFIKTKAIKVLFPYLPWNYKPLKLAFTLLPESFLDFFYDQIASIRYKLFTQSKVCDLTLKEKYFLP